VRPGKNRGLAVSGPWDDVLRRFLCLLPLLIVPGLFHRSTFSVFSTPKVTVVWLVAVLLFGSGVVRRIRIGRFARPSWQVEGVLGAFALAVAITALVSPYGHLAWWGVGVRWSGAVTYLAYVVIAWSCAVAFRERGTRQVVLAIVIGLVPVIAYALIQVGGRDPFDWAPSMSFGIDVMSTFGNPNFTSAFIAMAVPAVVTLAVQPSSRRLTRGLAGFIAGMGLVCIDHLGSLQGQIAVGSTLLVLAALVVDGRWSTRRCLVVLGPATIAIVVLPLGATRLGIPTAVVVSALLGACCAWPPIAEEKSFDRSVRSVVEDQTKSRFLRLWVGVLIGIMILGIGLVAVWSRIRGALGERWEFWRVALEIFVDRPLTGLGLETFGTRFAEFRGLEHVESSASHLSDSPHSVPLGLLAGGGILLVTAYCLLIAATGLAALRALRCTRGNKRLLVAGLCSSWVAFHLQSLVSVDLPALGVLHAVLAGVLMAVGSDAPDSRHIRLPGSDWWRQRSSGLRMGCGLLAGLLVVAVLTGPALRPLRADRAHHRAMVSLVSGETESAYRYLASATNLVPEDGVLWSLRSEVELRAGRVEEAYQSSARAARLRPGDPEMSLRAARNAVGLMVQPVYLEKAVRWYEAVLDADPSGPRRTEVAEFFRAIGRTDRAAEVWDGNSDSVNSAASLLDGRGAS